MQVVFQDPYASLDPRMTVREIVGEPLRINGIYAPGRVAELLARSASTRERRCAGRASSPAASDSASPSPARSRSRPDLVMLDEAVSALDVSIQAQVVNLLKPAADLACPTCSSPTIFRWSATSPTASP